MEPSITASPTPTLTNHPDQDEKKSPGSPVQDNSSNHVQTLNKEGKQEAADTDLLFTPPDELPHGTKLALIMAAIPVIANDFHALSDVGWYGSAYLLTGCALQPMAGKASGYFHLKWVFLGFVATFGVGSLICGAAKDSPTFIVGRAIAGVGFGGLYVGVLAIAAAVLPLEKQAMFTSVVGASFGIGACAGPVIGGSLTTLVTWRWCFYLNVPIVGATLVAIVFFLNPPIKPQSLSAIDRVKRMDWLGAALLLGSVISFLIALQDAGIAFPWKSSRIIGLLIGSILMFIAFGLDQVWMGDDASIPPRIFKQRSVFFLAALNFCVGPVYFTSLYFVPIYFQAVRGSSAIHSGVQALPLIVSIIIAIIVAGGLVTATGGYNYEMIFGTVVGSIGAGVLSTLKADSATGTWVGYQILTGFGIGTVAMMPYTASQIVLPQADRQNGATIAIFSQTLGATLFVSASQSIYQNKLATGFTHINGLDVAAVLGSGVSAFRDIVPPTLLPQVVEVAVQALSAVFKGAAGICAIGFVMALGVEWKKIEPGEKVVMGAV